MAIAWVFEENTVKMKYLTLKHQRTLSKIEKRLNFTWFFPSKFSDSWSWFYFPSWNLARIEKKWKICPLDNLSVADLFITRSMPFDTSILLPCAFNYKKQIYLDFNDGDAKLKPTASKRYWGKHSSEQLFNYSNHFWIKKLSLWTLINVCGAPIPFV